MTAARWSTTCSTIRRITTCGTRISMPTRTITPRLARRPRSERVFDTSIYLAAYPDVAAAGVNPLNHFDTIGWKEARVPSLAFDPRQYLAANPDVAAAGIDPLWHFLAVGASEGRQAFDAAKLITARGFDYVYYLAANPDVKAAGVDALWHFQTLGWMEGRIRTRCSTPPAISRPTPTLPLRTSIRSITTPRRAGARARILRSFDDVIFFRQRRRRGGEREPTHALPLCRSGRRTFGVRRWRVGVGYRRVRSWQQAPLRSYGGGSRSSQVFRLSACRHLLIRRLLIRRLFVRSIVTAVSDRQRLHLAARSPSPVPHATNPRACERSPLEDCAGRAICRPGG